MIRCDTQHFLQSVECRLRFARTEEKQRLSIIDGGILASRLACGVDIGLSRIKFAEICKDR
jgi:hypothetical protein